MKLENPWEEQHELMFNLVKVGAQCAYANSDYKTIQQQIQILLTHTTTALEKLPIYHLDVLQYIMQGPLS